MTHFVNDIPQVVVERLPQYLRALNELSVNDVEFISSQQFGKMLQVTPAQIRKDFSYFGRFGKQGRGYNIPYLVRSLRGILSLDRTWKVAVIGIGQLGRAIINYPEFAPEGFEIVCAFDADPQLAGKKAGSITIEPMSALKETLSRLGVHISIVAVPADRVPEVLNQLVACGIKSILSYAPTPPRKIIGVQVKTIDPVLALQSMTYYLGNQTYRGLRRMIPKQKPGQKPTVKKNAETLIARVGSSGVIVRVRTD